MMRTALSLLLLLGVLLGSMCASPANALVHDLSVVEDGRSQFFIENFGFAEQGHLRMRISGFQVRFGCCSRALVWSTPREMEDLELSLSPTLSNSLVYLQLSLSNSLVYLQLSLSLSPTPWLGIRFTLPLCDDLVSCVCVCVCVCWLVYHLF
jgi:hypothetical protein